MDISKYIVTEESPIRGIIFGRAGTGKTRGAMTFPNTTFLNFDNNLPRGVAAVPCWKPEFWPQFRPMPSAIADMYKKFSQAMPPEGTIIIDSLTAVERMFDTWEVKNPIFGAKPPAIDGFAMFKRRLVFWNELFELFRQSKHNLLVLMHEMHERNDDGSESQRVRPLLMGKAGDIVQSVFNCIMQSTIQNGKHVWRIKPSANVPARLWTPVPVVQEFIPQDYQELHKLLAQPLLS